MTCSTPPPGRTATEYQLLRALLKEAADFTAGAGWERQLPFAARRAYALAELGNPVQLTLQLYRHVSERSGQPVLKLLLDVAIQGTGRERWAAANAGFFLSHGTAQEVAAVITALQTDSSPVQEQLATSYYGAFYNA